MNNPYWIPDDMLDNFDDDEWNDDLADYWPEMPNLEGIDRFAEYAVSGEDDVTLVAYRETVE